MCGVISHYSFDLNFLPDLAIWRLFIGKHMNQRGGDRGSPGSPGRTLLQSFSVKANRKIGTADRYGGVMEQIKVFCFLR